MFGFQHIPTSTRTERRYVVESVVAQQARQCSASPLKAGELRQQYAPTANQLMLPYAFFFRQLMLRHMPRYAAAIFTPRFRYCFRFSFAAAAFFSLICHAELMPLCHAIHAIILPRCRYATRYYAVIADFPTLRHIFAFAAVAPRHADYYCHYFRLICHA